MALRSIRLTKLVALVLSFVPYRRLAVADEAPREEALEEAEALTGNAD